MSCTRSSPSRGLACLASVLVLAYPAFVYLAGAWSPKWLALALAIGALGWWLVGARTAVSSTLFVGAVLLASVGAALDDLFPLKLYPVMVNGLLLALFAASLCTDQSAVERLARLRDSAFPEEAVPYTRRVTQVWCLFFLVNGLLALGTVLGGSTRLWFWYNGAISYLMIGGLFAGEWLVRRRRFGPKHG